MGEIPFERSFSSHEKSQYWSSKNINEEGKFISPRSVIKGSANIKRIFDCPCGHSYESLPCSKSYCPYCSKPPKKPHFFSEDFENCIFIMGFLKSHFFVWGFQNRIFFSRFLKLQFFSAKFLKNRILSCNFLNHIFSWDLLKRIFFGISLTAFFSWGF